MKKRFLQLLLVAGMVLTLAGCKKEGSNEEETTTQIEFSNDSSDELDKALLAALIGENTSADKIIYDLDMPTIVDKNGVRWTISENEAVSASGKLTGTNKENVEVTVEAKMNSGTKYFKVTVISGDEAKKEYMNSIADSLIHNISNIRGNITLLSTAGKDKDIQITWVSDNTDVITDKTVGAFAAGVVTRQDTDTKVKLTATLTCGDIKVVKEFDVNVVKKADEKVYTDYVYTYFRGNIYGKGESQHIHMAVSEDGFFWTALNNNEAILKAELGTKGVRDSYLIRSPEGDHFYLIGTDLDANGGDWGAYGNKGSKYIRVWESDDLVNWSDERLIEIAPNGAGCMWAPEATYDETTGEYVVYWATGIVGGNGKKIYYAKTRDFFTFTEAKIYKDVDPGITYIDTTMTKYDGVYYRFTKNENELSILLETSDSVLGDFSLVKTKIAGETGVEGPAIYKINGQEKWCMYMDGYAGNNSGVGYFPLIADSLEDLKNANFRRLNANEYKMPDGAKHGSFIPVTAEEYKALCDKYMK